LKRYFEEIRFSKDQYNHMEKIKLMGETGFENKMGEEQQL
jgi:hypothetical protein